MPNTVYLSKQAEKFLGRLRDATLYSRLRSAIDGLTIDSRPAGCTKLVGEPDLYRLRVGDYRIVYQLKDGIPTVLVVSIGHRRDVYR